MEENCHEFCTSKVSIFNVLEEESQAKVSDYIVHRKYPQGTFICLEDDEIASFIVIHSGEAKLSRFDSDGKEQVLDILKPGSFFGEDFLFSTEHYNYNATAITDVETCEFTLASIHSIIKDYPRVSKQLMGDLLVKLRKYENMISSLSKKDAMGKVAYVLVELAKDDGVIDANDTNKVCLTLSLSRDNFASYAGVTRETLSRKLTQLEKDGYLINEGKVLTILDFAKLKNLL